jgi:hypothetical protein
MAYLSPNSFYSSFARKGKRTSNVPTKSPFSFTGSLGSPNTGHVSGSAIQPATYGGATASPAVAGSSTGGSSGGSSGSVPPPGFTATQNNLPPDPVYQAAIGALLGTEGNTLAGLTQQRGAYLSGAGYTEDPTTHAIAYDPNNPYSQAALLRKSYQQAKAGNTNSYADAGQGYAGSLQNAQNASTDKFNTSDNALTNAVINFLANNTIQQNAAVTDYNTGAAGALGTSVQAAPNNPLYSPASAGSAAGGTVSTDANGNTAVTGGSQLNPGWSIVYSPDGKPLYFIDPQGNRAGG